MTTKVANKEHPTYAKLLSVKQLMKELDIQFEYSNGQIKVIDNDVFGLKQKFILVHAEDTFEPFSNLKYFPISDFKLKLFEYGFSELESGYYDGKIAGLEFAKDLIERIKNLKK